MYTIESSKVRFTTENNVIFDISVAHRKANFARFFLSLPHALGILRRKEIRIKFPFALTAPTQSQIKSERISRWPMSRLSN